MDFGQALTLLKAGHRLTRAGWNGTYIGLATPTTQSELFSSTMDTAQEALEKAMMNTFRVCLDK